MKPDSLLIREHLRDGVAVLSLDYPPVNSLGLNLRNALFAALQRANSDSSVEAVVICSAGRMFCGGADIREFESGVISHPDVNDLNAYIEEMTKPVVAAIHGVALGAGLELAMSCHFRVGDSAAKFGLPEVSLGVLPGAGGTQRLPRLIGVSAAVDAILTGQMFNAKQAIEAGLIDRISNGDLIEEAVQWAKRCIGEHGPSKITSRLPVLPPPDTSLEDFFNDVSLRSASKYRGQTAAKKIIDCVKTAATAPKFERGLEQESQAFSELMVSAESKAMRYLFFSEREAARPPVGSDGELIKISNVGVLGAGTMGTGIALSFLAAGFPIILVDVNTKALEQGCARIAQTLESLVAKGRLTPSARDEQIGRLISSNTLESLAAVDLVIEAVFENMALKKEIAENLGKICKPHTIIATNTSTLDVDVLAEKSGRKALFLGMHFFSPANIMRLLEVVRGRETAPVVIATVLQLAKRLGKTPVVSGVCYGFIGNRMLEGYLRETDRLLMEGCTPAQIDNALEKFGMSMGPCRMMDMAGVDVNANVLQQRLQGGFDPNDATYRQVCLALHLQGRNGQKASAGYYRYEGRTAIPDPAVDGVAASLAERFGIKRRTDISDNEIVERCLYPLINEGYRILEEGIAQRVSDIDIVWTAGYGFPRYRGGPMYYASQIGAEHLIERLNYYGHCYPELAWDWQPAKVLLTMAEQPANKESHA